MVRADDSSGHASFTLGKYLCGICAVYYLQNIYPAEVLYNVVEGLLQDIVVSDIGSVNGVRTLHHVILDMGSLTGKVLS